MRFLYAPFFNGALQLAYCTNTSLDSRNWKDVHVILERFKAQWLH